MTKKESKKRKTISCEIGIDALIDLMVDCVNSFRDREFDDDSEACLNQSNLLRSYFRFALQKCRFSFPESAGVSKYTSKSPEKCKLDHVQISNISADYEYVVTNIIYSVFEKHIAIIDISEYDFDVICGILRKCIRCANYRPIYKSERIARIRDTDYGKDERLGFIDPDKVHGMSDIISSKFLYRHESEL